MKLNKWHRDIIEHRPTDCIIDASFDVEDKTDNELVATMSEDEASEYVETLKGEWEWAASLDIAGLNPVQRHVLWDIIHGSTRAACLVDRTVFGKPVPHVGCEAEYRAICKAGRELAREFSKHHGKVEFPVV